MNRKQKLNLYEKKYGMIPDDEKERLEYMIDKYKIGPTTMQNILTRIQTMLNNLEFIDLDVVVLYEEPEGAKRPRYRITHKNFAHAALQNDFVHVYSPNAAEDHRYMTKLVQNDLCELIYSGLIYQPVMLTYDLFYKTPEAYNKEEKMLAEAGYIRPNIDKPDWDNGGKKYCDMYNANIFYDDSQVIEGTVRKYYSIKPRVVIHMRYLNALYNRKQAIRIANRKDVQELNTNGILYLNEKGELEKYEQ